MPWNRRFGWALGKGRWIFNNINSGTQNTGGGVDILLTPDANDSSVRIRHACLPHSLDSFLSWLLQTREREWGRSTLSQAA